MVNDQTEDALFEAMIAASGVPVSDEEMADLRKAYGALMALSARTRRPDRDRSWEVRMLPHYTPAPPEGP